MPRRTKTPRPLLERLLIATVAVCIGAMLLMALIATGRSAVSAAPTPSDVTTR